MSGVFQVQFFNIYLIFGTELSYEAGCMDRTLLLSRSVLLNLLQPLLCLENTMDHYY